MTLAATIPLGVRGVGLRSAGDADRSLIFHAWLKSFGRSEFAKAMAEPVYMASQHRVIERVLARGAALVLHPDGDPATALGWIAYEPGVLHFVYVKGRLRKAGFGSALMAAAFGGDAGQLVYTHRTVLGEHLLRRLNAIYNPMRAYAE